MSLTNRRNITPNLLTISVNSPKANTFTLEAPLHPTDLYREIAVYLKNNLTAAIINNEKDMQNFLGKRVTSLPEFAGCDMDPDFRLGELLCLIAIHQTRNAIYPLNKSDLIVYPAWQTRNQQDAIQNLTGKKSWDGYLAVVPQNTKVSSGIVPIEIKSNGRNPNSPVNDSPSGLLEDTVLRFSSYFQTEGSISCILLLPYSNEPELVIDLESCANAIRNNVSDKSLGVICAVSFYENADKTIESEIICAFITPDIDYMSPQNHKKWLRRVKF